MGHVQVICRQSDSLQGNLSGPRRTREKRHYRVARQIQVA